MWETARAKLRDWYIFIIGLCLIAGSFFLASHQSSSTAPSLPSQVGQAPHQTSPARPSAMSTKPEQNPSPIAPVVASQIHEPAVQSRPPANHPAGPQAAAADAQTPPAAGIASKGADPIAGRQVFRKCQACHSLEPGKAIFGPSLAAIIGREAGSEAGYNYSPAMKQANIVWDAKTLDAYLTDPQKLVPGNKMPFPGLETEQDRADVIAFIATSNSGAATNAGAPSGAPPQSVR